MRHGRRITLALFLAASAVPLGAEVPETVDPARIPSYKRIEAGLATAGRPAPEAVAQLKALGFRTVVNLQTEKEEGVATERASIEGQGLRYVSVPMTPDSFSLADVVAVEKVLADPSAGPVLLHCQSSNRVGGVWAAVQARKGRSYDQALAAGREAGLRSPAMIAAVRRVLGLPAEPAAAPAPAPVKP
jgi:uncharacterized protein (TIGR01244 family)